MTDQRWYQNPALLQAARDEYGTWEEASKQIGGVSASTLIKWWGKLGLGKLQPGPVPKGSASDEALKRLYDRVYG